MTLILGKLTWVTSEIKHFYHPIINVKAIKIFDKNFNLYKQFDVNVPTGYRLIISKPNEAVNSFILL